MWPFRSSSCTGWLFCVGVSIFLEVNLTLLGFEFKIVIGKLYFDRFCKVLFLCRHITDCSLSFVKIDGLAENYCLLDYAQRTVLECYMIWKENLKQTKNIQWCSHMILEEKLRVCLGTDTGTAQMTKGQKVCAIITQGPIRRTMCVLYSNE